MCHRFWHGSTAAANVLQTAQIKLRHVGAAQQVNDHGGNVGPVCDLPFGNKPAGQISVPTWHQNERGAQENGGMHDTYHARDVKHGHHAQAFVLRRAIGPQATGHGVVHDGAMRVHATFRQACGAAGVGQHSQIFRLGRDGAERHFAL